MDDSGFTITIVGIGLIGGSYAMAFKKLNKYKIYGIDVNDNVINKAESLGIIDKGFNLKNARIPLNASDIVMIALYPEATEEFIKGHLNEFKSGAVVADNSGVKKEIIKRIQSIMPDNVEFIGCHPMAGRESGGLDYASDKIFIDCNYIFTPTKYNSEKNILKLTKIMKEIGCKNIIHLSPDEHDSIISLTSQLPHVIAVSLMNHESINDKTRFCIGGSFKDETRVAEINSKLWTELLLMNANNVLNDINKFIKNVNQVKNAIESNDHNELKNILDRANENRKELMKDEQIKC